MLRIRERPDESAIRGCAAKKAIVTGQNLPSDVNQETQGSPFLKQYDPSAPGSVRDPSLLPNTDLTNAFTQE